ncbi:MAG: cytochrome b/b6 domain-containing protein [Polynucleobacter sp.]|uniref:cytochrome b/b6 domain-containing protein n=1 Tax=Polynucleobacter sp. TaxID=2029855 RepID=UPI002723E802|nr:cytochrome b/b6 domain-containing protein [Polynucleobacter sp.]MDO8713721.1 cytochrome b/b6 domain-containing protein [Polynucleobacter sp.]
MNSIIKRIQVWDLPTRVFHWCLVLCFIGAIATQESEEYRIFHVTFGYTMMGLVIFRLLWGIIGSRYSKFSSFFFGFKKTREYVIGLLKNKPVHYLGHNPLGSIAIYLILLIVIAISVTGYCIFNDIGSNWYSEAHELFANLLITVVVIHVFGVAISSYLHKENLVRSMITGFKCGITQEGIKQNFSFLVVALAIIGSIGYFWFYQFGMH